MSGNLSLERGIMVLETLREQEEALGVRELARRLDLSAPAIQRILNTLLAQAYVEQDPVTRRYRLGHAVLALAQHVVARNRLVESAEPELKELAAEGCFNGFLGIRHGRQGIYLLTVQSKSPVVIRAAAGDSFALHSTALGKALLIGMDEAAYRAALGQEPLDKLTERTVTDPEQLMTQIQAAARTGYTSSLDENYQGLLAVGAPVRNAAGAVVAAISVAYPRAVGPQTDLPEIGRRIMAAAQRISAELGFAHAVPMPDGER